MSWPDAAAADAARAVDRPTPAQALQEVASRIHAAGAHTVIVPIRRALVLALVPWALLGCSSTEPPATGDALEPKGEPTMQLRSPAFLPNEAMDPRFTCEGADVSPPLEWSGVPEGTRSLALVVDDPDAPDPARPKRTWVHWIAFDIPPTVASLPEGASTALPAGARTGTNDWGKTRYGGPCPPIGRHRYFHKLYALDTILALQAPTKAELEAAMAGHVLGHAELVGTYQKAPRRG